MTWKEKKRWDKVTAKRCNLGSSTIFFSLKKSSTQNHIGKVLVDIDSHAQYIFELFILLLI